MVVLEGAPYIIDIICGCVGADCRFWYVSPTSLSRRTKGNLANLVAQNYLQVQFEFISYHLTYLLVYL